MLLKDELQYRCKSYIYHEIINNIHHCYEHTNSKYFSRTLRSCRSINSPFTLINNWHDVFGYNCYFKSIYRSMSCCNNAIDLNDSYYSLMLERAYDKECSYALSLFLERVINDVNITWPECI